MQEGPSSVSLLVAMEHHYSRRAALGAKAFFRSLDEDVHVLSLRSGSRWEGRATNAGVQGVVGFFSAGDVERIRQLGVPCANIAKQYANEVPSVQPDHYQIGRLAAEHFLQRGFSRYLFLSYSAGHTWDERYNGFRDCLAREGDEAIRVRWGGDLTPELTEHLLPDTAVLAATDHSGLRLVEVCHAAGIEIPGQIAVLSVDNDDMACDLAEVPLSSIDPNPERIGWLAAEMLWMQINDRSVPEELVLVPPKGVVDRESTERFAFPDPDLRQALAFISEHACDPISVGDMVQGLGVSRRTIEKRFRQYLGRTVHDEIERVRFETGRRLLLETGLRITEVADRCGFPDHSRFSSLFSKRFGMPPTRYRKKFRVAEQANV